MHEAILKELFAAIPKEEQEVWVRLAKEKHDNAVKRWKEEVSSEPSAEPSSVVCVHRLFPMVFSDITTAVFKGLQRSVFLFWMSLPKLLAGKLL